MANDYRRGNKDYCEPTYDDPKMLDVIGRSECKKHKAGLFDPCWKLEGVITDFFAVCNTRARKAGFTGKITPTALNLKHRKAAS